MNKNKTSTIVMIALTLIMAAAGMGVLIYMYNQPNADGATIMTVASNAFEIALLGLLIIQNRLSSNTASSEGNYFCMVLFVMCVKIAADQVSYAIDGVQKLIWLNWLMCSLTYLCTMPLTFFFWNYCGHNPGISEKEFIIIKRIILILGVATTLLFLINPVVHIFFYIDGDGYFHLMPTYWIMLIQSFFGSTACITAVLKAKLKLSRKLLMTAVFLTPFFGIILGIISDELTFMQYLCITLVLFFCYVSIYIRDEDRYKAKLKELDLAASIQRGALREDFGDFNDHRIHAYMKPAREVGGDFYDFFNVDDHTTGLLIADVSGKGIPAAMFMMQGLTAIRELARSGVPANEVFEKANDLLCAHNENELFITAWMAYIDRKTGRVTYVNAGHNPPLLKHHSGDAEYIKCRPGMVLAAMEGLPYRINEFVMDKGDTLFMYTDGIPEAQTADNELYGEDRLIALVKEADGAPDRLTSAVLKGVNTFVGDAEQFDDMTIISFERV